MKRYVSYVILAAALALPSVALAQGSGTTAPDAKKNNLSFSVTRTVTGKVVAIKTGKSLVIESGGTRQEFKLARETRAPSGLKNGDAVKVTYRASDHTAMEVVKTKSTS